MSGGTGSNDIQQVLVLLESFGFCCFDLLVVQGGSSVAILLHNSAWPSSATFTCRRIL